MKLISEGKLTALVTAAVGALALSSAQGQVTFTGSGTAAGDGASVAASATFNNVGGHLVITLVNTYTGSTMDNADTLYGVFFNGASGLTEASVQEAAGDSVYSFPTTTPTVLGANTAIFNWQMTTLGGQSGIDGLQGGPENGLVSEGFNPLLITHGGIANGSHDPYVQDDMIITFNQNLSLSSIDDVFLLYGTTLSTDNTVQGHLVPVPEASTVFAGALMLLPLGIGAIRALRKERLAAKIS